MYSIIISYTVPEAFAETNKKNIAAFLKEFGEYGASKFKYQVLVREDGVSFMHIASFQDEKTWEEMVVLPTYAAFTEQRDANMEDDDVTTDTMNTVGQAGTL